MLNSSGTLWRANQTPFFARLWFFSVYPGCGQQNLDTMIQVWDFGLAYVLPPFSLQPKGIMKIAHFNGRFILLALVWPTRVWFSLLRSLASEPPLMLPNTLDLILQHYLRHPHLDRICLAAWISNARY